MKKKMTTARAQSESVTDVPIEGKKYTLYPGTLGHRAWLLERKNKVLMTGVCDEASVVEICFAYTQEPFALQAIKGAKASELIKKFHVTLTDEEFQRLQTHAEAQLLKFIKTASVPKKAQAQASRKPARRATKRR